MTRADDRDDAKSMMDFDEGQVVKSYRRAIVRHASARVRQLPKGVTIAVQEQSVAGLEVAEEADAKGHGSEVTSGQILARRPAAPGQDNRPLRRLDFASSGLTCCKEKLELLSEDGGEDGPTHTLLLVFFVARGGQAPRKLSVDRTLQRVNSPALCRLASTVSPAFAPGGRRFLPAADGDCDRSRDVSDPPLRPRFSFRPRPRRVAHVPAARVSVGVILYLKISSPTIGADRENSRRSARVTIKRHATIMSKAVALRPPGFDDLSVDDQIVDVQSLWD